MQQISPLRAPPTHTCAQAVSARHPADARCASLSHVAAALQRELLPSRRGSITRNRLTLEWAAASEVIDTTPAVIRQVVRIFFSVTSSGETAADVREWIGRVRVKVSQRLLTIFGF